MPLKIADDSPFLLIYILKKVQKMTGGGGEGLNGWVGQKRSGTSPLGRLQTAAPISIC